jgi:hypothetical protein
MGEDHGAVSTSSTARSGVTTLHRTPSSSP